MANKKCASWVFPDWASPKNNVKSPSLFLYGSWFQFAEAKAAAADTSEGEKILSVPKFFHRRRRRRRRWRFHLLLAVERLWVKNLWKLWPRSEKFQSLNLVKKFAEYNNNGEIIFWKKIFSGKFEEIVWHDHCGDDQSRKRKIDVNNWVSNNISINTTNTNQHHMKLFLSAVKMQNVPIITDVKIEQKLFKAKIWG